MTARNGRNYNELTSYRSCSGSIPAWNIIDQRKESEPMDNDVNPTWRLAWGLWWRMFLISLGVFAIISLILFAVGVAFIPWAILF